MRSILATRERECVDASVALSRTSLEPSRWQPLETCSHPDRVIGDVARSCNSFQERLSEGERIATSSSSAGAGCRLGCSYSGHQFTPSQTPKLVPNAAIVRGPPFSLHSHRTGLEREEKTRVYDTNRRLAGEEHYCDVELDRPGVCRMEDVDVDVCSG